MVYSAVLAEQTVLGSSPEPPLMLVDTSKRLAARLTFIRSADVPKVNLLITQVRKQAKGSNLDFKPRAVLTISPIQGYQWPHKKDLCPPKIYLRKKMMMMMKGYLLAKLLSLFYNYELKPRDVSFVNLLICLWKTLAQAM